MDTTSSSTATYTGLPAFRDAVGRELMHTDRQDHAIWYLDVKKFRFINESYGYSTGDTVLAEISAYLGDMLEGRGTFARLSDDRFVIYAHRVMSDEVKSLFERSFREFNRRLSARGVGHPIEVAAGVYFLTPDDLKAPDVSHMIDLAHTAQRRAKLAGGSSIALFDYALFEKQQREMTIAETLDDAIVAGEVEVWMQPQLDYISGDIVGAEALARWNHATLGRLSPGEFIPVLERNGRIRDLDRFIWEDVCRQAHYWAAETGGEMVPFSVNISRAEILDPDLADYFLGLQEKYHLPEQTLRLEVTESTYTEQPEELIRAVNRLREAGFIVEMDDFGTGYSSLNMLRNLPVDVLKLDMGFLQGADEEGSDGIILNCVIRMAHGLDIPIIAEGVETLEQAEMLKTMGCRLMQGYYFSRPLPIEQFHDLLHDSKAHRQSFAWAQKLDHVNELLDMKGESPFLFNHCIGGAVVFTFNDNRYETVLANDKFFEELGLGHEARSIFSGQLGEYLTPASVENARTHVLRAIEGKHSRCELQVEKTGRWLDCTLHHIGGDDRGDTLIALVRDITSEHLLLADTPATPEQANELQRRAALDRDPQTDMLSRASFIMMLNGDLGKEGGCLMLVDIDDFASLAKRIGREEADKAVTQVASILRGSFEKTALLARLDHDIFAVLTPGSVNQTQVRARACQLINSFRQIVLSHGAQVTCSIGIARADAGDIEATTELYHRAVRALYMVKFNGKDAFLLYELAQMATLPGTDSLAVSLRHSVDGELVPLRTLEGTDLFSAIGADMQESHPWDSAADSESEVRDQVFSAMRYHTMSHLPGILSFDYDPGTDTMIFETIDETGISSQRRVEHFHKHLFDFGDKIAEESMARLASSMLDLEYLPTTGTLDLKCRLYGDDDYRWYRFSYTCLRDKEEQLVIRGLGYGEDIDLARESTAWWKDRAVHDGLTGLLNREGLEDAIASQLRKRSGGMMFLIDIDDFKDVNDALGHLSGDSVLCTVADTLLCMFRENDVVGRFGGDEFIAFISGFHDLELARGRAEALVASIADIEVGQYGHIGCSVGVAVEDSRNASFYQLLQRSDHAVRASKAQGKGTYHIDEGATLLHAMADAAESHHTNMGFEELAHRAVDNRRFTRQREIDAFENEE